MPHHKVNDCTRGERTINISKYCVNYEYTPSTTIHITSAHRHLTIIINRSERQIKTAHALSPLALAPAVCGGDNQNYLKVRIWRRYRCAYFDCEGGTRFWIFSHDRTDRTNRILRALRTHALAHTAISNLYGLSTWLSSWSRTTNNTRVWYTYHGEHIEICG